MTRWRARQAVEGHRARSRTVRTRSRVLCASHKMAELQRNALGQSLAQGSSHENDRKTVSHVGPRPDGAVDVSERGPGLRAAAGDLGIAIGTRAAGGGART